MSLPYTPSTLCNRPISLLLWPVVLLLCAMSATRHVVTKLEPASGQGLVLAGIGVLFVAGMAAWWFFDRHVMGRLTRLGIFAESAVDGVIMIDTDGTIEFFNHAAERMFGYQADELLGENVSLIVPTPHKQRHDAYLADHLRGITFNIIDLRREVLGLRKDGSTFPVDLHVGDLHVGNQRFFAGILTDITDRKRVEAQLEETRIEAESANRAKSEFLANMSHEIRTPMTAILGFADTLLDPDLTDEERLTAVDTICRNGKHLLKVINEILDLTKIEAEKLEIHRVRFSPVQLLAEVQSLMRLRADEKGLELSFEVAGCIPETIESDPARLRQILINLIGNAIKFTSEGSVRVIACLLPDDKVPMIEFSVIDTGIGVSEDGLASLFQPFTQADSSTTRSFGGTGLGLAISKRLTHMLGGELSAHSQLGEGSTFRATVTIGPLEGVPMIDPPQKIGVDHTHTSQPEHKSVSTRLRNCRVLLVEDCPDNQRLVKLVLKKSGADVTVAENGQVALEKVLANMNQKRHGNSQDASPFDVILMDMQMPLMDGYAATAMLRKKGYDRPIIALTAHAMPGDREKCLAAGCDDYATKPVNRDTLVELVSRYTEPTQPLSSKPS